MLQSIGVDTVGKNESRIAEYIKKQLEKDKLGELLTMPGYETAFVKKKQETTKTMRLAGILTRLTCCEEQRPMAAYEKPPARPVDVYSVSLNLIFYKRIPTGIAF